jgi:hypothetical protein
MISTTDERFRYVSKNGNGFSKHLYSPRIWGRERYGYTDEERKFPQKKSSVMCNLTHSHKNM